MSVIADTLGAAEPKAREAIDAIYGRSLSVLEVYTDGLYLVAASAEPEARLRSMLESRGRAKTKGLNAEMFSPLPTDVGSYVLFDVSRLLTAIKAAVPAEGPGHGEFSKVQAAFAGPAGRFRLGIGFDADAVTFHAAIPMATVEAIGHLVGVEQEATGG
jgi:hypothetical protein